MEIMYIPCRPLSLKVSHVFSIKSCVGVFRSNSITISIISVEWDNMLNSDYFMSSRFSVIFPAEVIQR